MKKSYVKAIKNKILLQNILVAACLIALAIFIYIKTRPQTINFIAEDSCGFIGNTVSHVISSDEDCKNDCWSRCLSFKTEYLKSKYVYNDEKTCNNCSCTCRKI